MRIDIAALSDVGRRKKNNEDTFAVFRENTPKLALFREGAMLCVADGLGGHTAGDVASKLAVATFRDCLKEPVPEPCEDPEEYDSKYFDILKAYIAKANENLHQTNKELVKMGRPMGTTLLAALVDRRKVYVANVGDSRCYHIRDGEIVTMTVDHSWVDEQVALGLMTKTEAETDSRKNLLTRCIGTHPEVPVDTYLWHVVPGDRILLCTDGLVNMMKDAEIREIFRTRGTSADYAQRLVDRANANGGKDNITVIVAHINPGFWHFIGVRFGSFLYHHRKKLLWGALTVLIGAVCFAAGYFARGLTLQ